MTVSSATRKAGPFAGNNLATTFPFNFKVFAKGDIKLLLVNPSGVSSQLTLDSDYSVQVNANQDTQPGGWATYPINGTPLPIGYELVLLGDLAYDQETDLTNAGGFYPRTIEDMSDRSTIQIQQLAEIASRAIVIPEAESAQPILPTAQARANTVVGFDALGNMVTLPLPAGVGAGDLKNEAWTDGTDFTGGTSTSVLLSRAYGSKANLGTVVMDGVAQDPATYSLSGGGTVLGFNAVIPAFVSRIWCVGGTTLSTFVPPDGSVGVPTLASDVLAYFTAAGFSSVAVGAEPRSVQSKLNDTVSVKDFGAVGDGVADDTTAIQAAINSGARRIYFPAATYLITNALNCTNLATTGVPLHLFGDGVQHDHGTTTAGTIILCRTAGANSGWMVDFTGTQFATIEDMMFLASGANASTKGFLFARSTRANFAQNNSMRRVMILIPSNIGASVVGSIAVANNCAEQFVVDECWLQADTPLLSTLVNEVGLTSPFAVIANTTFSNTTYMVRGTTFQPLLFSGIIAYGLATAFFDSCVIIPVTPFTYPHAITLRSSAQGYQICANISFTGQVESFATVLRMEGNTESIEATVSTSNVTGNHVSLVLGTSHQNFRYRPTLLNTAGVNMILSTGSSVTLYGGELVLSNTMTLIDPNLILAGTMIDGANNDMSSGAIFSVATASSYSARWVNARINFAETYNPGGITTAGSVTSVLAAAGVRLTDKIGFAAPYDLQGALVTASVASAGNIRVTIGNLTGGTIVLGSGTWRFWAERPTF